MRDFNEILGISHEEDNVEVMAEAHANIMVQLKLLMVQIQNIQALPFTLQKERLGLDSSGDTKVSAKQIENTIGNLLSNIELEIKAANSAFYTLSVPAKRKAYQQFKLFKNAVVENTPLPPELAEIVTQFTLAS